MQNNNLGSFYNFRKTQHRLKPKGCLLCVSFEIYPVNWKAIRIIYLVLSYKRCWGLFINIALYFNFQHIWAYVNMNKKAHPTEFFSLKNKLIDALRSKLAYSDENTVYINHLGGLKCIYFHGKHWNFVWEGQ